jgi:hypothetical protein
VKDLRERARFIRRADVVRHTAGRIFTAEFTKRNGQTRRILARTGVHRFTNGKGMKYEPADFDLLVVYDMQAKDYRMINLSTLINIRCGDYSWERDV